jgi:hypothetical protein
MSMLRREFGIAEPIRRAMEVKICQEGEWRPAVLGYKGEGLHEQILSGRDGSVDWEDVFNGEFYADEDGERIEEWWLMTRLQATRLTLRLTSTRRWRISSR